MGGPRTRRHALGQNFLVDSGVARAALALAELGAGSSVLEIGPGHGALTEVLLAAGHEVFAVEIDPALAASLSARGHDRLHVELADFLRLPLSAVPAKVRNVVANLPYSSGTAMVSRLVGEIGRFDRIVVLLQREVAERLCAGPGGHAYGALSVLTALGATARLGPIVPPSAFRPQPKVESALVRLDCRMQIPEGVPDVAAFRRVVRGAFGQRRKTLRNALGSALGREAALLALAAAGIDGERRAETLTFGEFGALTRAALALAGDSPTGAGSAPTPPAGPAGEGG